MRHNVIQSQGVQTCINKLEKQWTVGLNMAHCIFKCVYLRDNKCNEYMSYSQSFYFTKLIFKDILNLFAMFFFWCNNDAVIPVKVGIFFLLKGYRGRLAQHLALYQIKCRNHPHETTILDIKSTFEVFFGKFCYQFVLLHKT